MGFLSSLIDFLKSLLSGGKREEEHVSEQSPAELTTPDTSDTGNYYPRLLRVTNINPELTSDVVGPDKSGQTITLTRKGLLYAAICCEVQCDWKIVLEAITTDEFGRDVIKTSIKSGKIMAKDSGAKSHTITLQYPNGDNGYILGKNLVTITIYDLNGRKCGVKQLTLNVVMP